MPAYEGILTDGEIIAVLSFIKSTWSAEADHAAGARRHGDRPGRSDRTVWLDCLFRRRGDTRHRLQSGLSWPRQGIRPAQDRAAI